LDYAARRGRADSFAPIGELYTAMGDRFGRVYYQSAVEAYQFLLREYPKSKFAQDVLLRTGNCSEQSGRHDFAMKRIRIFEAFSRSTHKAKRRILAELFASAK